MTDYIYITLCTIENKKLLYDPIHIHKRHLLSRLRIRSKMNDNYHLIDKQNKKIEKKQEEKIKVEDVLQENDVIYLDGISIYIGGSFIHEVKFNLDANLMLIRSGKSPKEFAPVIDDKFLFLDKAGNLVPLVNESKIKAREIAKYNEKIFYYFLEIELDPKFYKEHIVLKKNDAIIAYLPGIAYKEARYNYRKSLKLKDTEAFIQPFYDCYHNRIELFPCENEDVRTLFFTNVFFEEKENVVYLCDLPDGQKVNVSDIFKELIRARRLGNESRRQNKNN